MFIQTTKKIKPFYHDNLYQFPKTGTKNHIIHTISLQLMRRE